MPLKLFQPKVKKESSIRHVIAIAAGKGGVGKSTITTNLALALHELKFKVGVLDADLYGPSLRRMLPEDIPPAQQGELFVPGVSNGIKLMTMGFFRKEGQASVVRAPIANNLINQFLKNVLWEDLDFLLIDYPPGTGDIQLTLSQQANLRGALIVTTPQEIALMDVRKCIQMFEIVQVPILGILENMSYYYNEATQDKVYLFGKGGGEKLSREYGAPYLGSIPIDPLIGRCLDEGTSLFKVQDTNAKALQMCFLNLAKEVSSHAESLKEQSSNSLASFELIWKEMV